MITHMSNKIASFFVLNNVIKNEDKEAYRYSLEILLSTLLNLITVIIISVLANKFIETVFYFLGFVPLRIVAGGYHAKTHFRCFLILLFTYSTFILIICFFPSYMINITILLSITISTFLIFLLSPIEDSNKPLSEKEVKIFKKKSRLCILIFLSVVLVLYFTLPYLAISFVFGILTLALSLLASVARNKINDFMAKNH